MPVEEITPKTQIIQSFLDTTGTLKKSLVGGGEANYTGLVLHNNSVVLSIHEVKTEVQVAPCDDDNLWRLFDKDNSAEVIFTLKTPYRDGATQVGFDPADFTSRLP